MNDYTEGPWELANGCFLYKIDPDTGCNRFWANFTPGDWANEDEAKANARLCKAAPDLLEALEWIVGMGEDVRPFCQKGNLPRCVCRDCWEDRAREAIKKARGER